MVGSIVNVAATTQLFPVEVSTTILRGTEGGSMEEVVGNGTALPEPVTADDATWILTASFVIFTMQTGFGLLESGAVAKKNEVNIMMKNAADVILGGLSYWMYGYGLQYGTDPGTNPFCGVGYFLLDADPDEMGIVFATFIFQLSFATTATTIVSGAMAERTDFNAYCIFSFLNTITYCIPAGWLWGEHGFLYQMGAIDFAGSSGVHLLGGASALVAAIMLKPRLRRYTNGTDPLPMGNPTNAVVGTFTLWWGWLVFNCGSTFGISDNKWHFAGRAAVTTINASISGGIVGLIFSYAKCRKFEVGDLVNSLLGALVAITAGCAFYRPWEALVVGLVGGIIALLLQPLMDRLRIDDPVGAVAVHGGSGIWGMAAVGLFIDGGPIDPPRHKGLFKGGGFYLLGVQLLSCVCITLWSASTTWILLKGINFFIPIRLSPTEEILGADFVEHHVRHEGYDYEAMIREMFSQGMNVSERLKLVDGRMQFDLYLVKKYGRPAAPKSESDAAEGSLGWRSNRVERGKTQALRPSLISHRFLSETTRRPDNCVIF